MKPKFIAHIFLIVALVDAITFSGISITRSLILSNSKVSNQTAAVLQKTTPSTLSSGAKVNMSRPDVQKAITALQANPTDKQQVLAVQNALVRNRMLTTNQVTGVFDDATKKAAAIYSKMTPLSSTKPTSAITAKASSDACKYVPRMEGTTFVPDPDYIYGPAYTQPFTIVGSQVDSRGVIFDPNYMVEQAGAGETTISAMDKGVTNSVVMQNAFDCHNDADDKLLFDWSKPTGYSSDSTVPPSQLRLINGISTDRRITGSDGDRYLTGGQLALYSHEIDNSGYLCDSTGLANKPNFCAAISKFVASNPSANWYDKYFSLYIDRSNYSGFAPSPYTVFYPTDAAAMKTNEDAAINVIQTTNKMAVVAQNGLTAEIPATNCVHVAGEGPVKIIFLRGKTIGTSTLLNSAKDFVSNSLQVIKKGFKQVEPFKSYYSRFSFYVDVTIYPSDSGPYSKVDAVEYSGCSKSNVLGDVYLYYVYDKVTEPSGEPGLVYINTYPLASVRRPGENWNYYANSPMVEMHEISHALAFLNDEYLYSEFGSVSNFNQALFKTSNTENCTLNWSKDFRSTEDNHFYGNKRVRGCTYMYVAKLDNDGNVVPPISSPKAIDPRPYYRPSLGGIMSSGDYAELKDTDVRFNVISCGYIIAAIKKEPINKANAQKYWKSDCLPMAQKGQVIMDGIVGATSMRPGDVKLSASSVAAGLSVTITGTNFTPDSNAVHLTNTSTRVEYDIDELTSTSNGTLLTVTIPNTVTPGSYDLKVGALDSDWSNSIPLTVTAAGAPVTTSPVITSFTSSNAYMIIGSNKTFTLSWTATNASSCWLSDTGSSKTLPIISTVTKGPISQNTTYTLTCSNSTVTPATTVSKSLTVSAVTEKSLRTDGGNN